MKKINKKQAEYIARTIMPEIYECQKVADASLEDLIKRYFGEDSSSKVTVVSRE